MSDQDWTPKELEFLREATEVSASDVALLRSRVFEAVERPRRAWLSWTPAAALAAMAILLALWIGRPAPLETLALRPPAPPPAPPVRMAARRPPIGKARPALPVLARNVPAQRPVISLIRLETPDPNVVILIVPSEGGF